MKSKASKPHYGVQCLECKKRMFSLFRHDYRLCGCPNETMVDGGFDYTRWGWKTTKPKRISWTDRLDGKLPAHEPKEPRWPY